MQKRPGNALLGGVGGHERFQLHVRAHVRLHDGQVRRPDDDHREGHVPAVHGRRVPAVAARGRVPERARRVRPVRAKGRRVRGALPGGRARKTYAVPSVRRGRRVRLRGHHTAHERVPHVPGLPAPGRLGHHRLFRADVRAKREHLHDRGVLRGPVFRAVPEVPVDQRGDGRAAVRDHRVQQVV